VPQIVVIDRQGIIRAQSRAIPRVILGRRKLLTQSNRRSLERKQAQLGEQERLEFQEKFVNTPQSRRACISLYLQGLAEGALFTLRPAYIRAIDILIRTIDTPPSRTR